MESMRINDRSLISLCSCCIVMTVSFAVEFSRSTCTGRRRGCCSSRRRSACRSSCTSRTGTWRRTSPGLKRNITTSFLQFQFIYVLGMRYVLIAFDAKQLYISLINRTFSWIFPRKTCPCSKFAHMWVCVNAFVWSCKFVSVCARINVRMHNN